MGVSSLPGLCSEPIAPAAFPVSVDGHSIRPAAQVEKPGAIFDSSPLSHPSHQQFLRLYLLNTSRIRPLLPTCTARPCSQPPSLFTWTIAVAFCLVTLFPGLTSPQSFLTTATRAALLSVNWTTSLLRSKCFNGSCLIPSKGQYP